MVVIKQINILFLNLLLSFVLYGCSIEDLKRDVAINDHIEKGNKYLHDDINYDKAIAHYNKAIKLDPHNETTLNSRGYSYHKNKNYKKAINDYNKVLDINPNNKVALLNRALAYNSVNKYNLAINDLNKLIKINPFDYKAYFSRVNSYRHIAVDQMVNKDIPDFNKAISDFTKTIELKPDFGLAYKNRGICFYIDNRFAKALTDIKKAKELGESVSNELYSSILNADKSIIN